MIDEYAFESMSFRWGPSDASGSEHILNGRSFPLELQVKIAKQIHTKRLLNNFNTYI